MKCALKTNYCTPKQINNVCLNFTIKCNFFCRTIIVHFCILQTFCYSEQKFVYSIFYFLVHEYLGVI